MPPAPRFEEQRVPSRIVNRLTMIILALAVGMHLAALIHATPLQSANDRSRWATVWSLAERGTFEIDAIDRLPAWRTIDKVQVDGHLYSTKPALLQVITAGLYKVLRDNFGWSIVQQTPLVTRVLLGVINLLPWILALVAISVMARKYAERSFTRLFVLATAGFGTFLSTYSVTYNNHTIAACALVFALYFTTRIVRDHSTRAWHYLLAGLTAAFVTTQELPAAVFGVALFCFLFWHDRWRTLSFFVPAALLPIAAFVITTWMQTGSWKPFYLTYGTETYQFIRDGVPSYWADPRGIDRNIDPPGLYFFHCIFGHHGIFSLSPVFLLTLASWLQLRRELSSPLRALNLMGLSLTFVILAFYLSRTENYNYGGNSVALRWAIWLVPFWILGLIPIVDRYSQNRNFRLLAVALLAISTFSAWESIRNPWGKSWMFQAYEVAGLIDYRDPPPELEHPLSTLFATLPPAAADPSTEWIELTSPTRYGQETLRLSLESADADSATIRWNRAEILPNQPPRRLEDFTATWARGPFLNGSNPERILRESTFDRDATLRLFQGLPYPVDYQPRQIQYVTAPGQEFAFRSTQVTASVDVRRATGEILRHRLDAWICPDVPFGLVKLRQTIEAVSNRQILEQREYLLSATGRRETPEWVQRIQALTPPDRNQENRPAHSP